MPLHRIAGAAVNQIPLHWKNNLDNIHQAITEAKDKKVSLLCFPELCVTGYGCEDLFLSEWLPAKAVDLFFREILKSTIGIACSFGLPVKKDGFLYNCAFFCVNGSLKAIVPKQNLANDGVHYEPRWFTPWKPGELTTIELNGEQVSFGDQLIEWEGFKVGFEICEDAWREARPGISLGQRGVDLILNPSASHFAMGKSKHREEVILTGADRFNCTYLYANLLGNEAGRMIYDGEVYIRQPGRLVQRNRKCSFRNINLVYADVDLRERTAPPTELNQDFFDKNNEFVQAASLGLFDYLRKSRSQGFVLSLSGGADSGCCAVLVSEMVIRGVGELGTAAFLQKLGVKSLLQPSAEHYTDQEIVSHLLTCVYQGTANSSSDTFESARALAVETGATFHHWLIDQETASYRQKIETATGRKLTWEEDDITLQNIQARGRSPGIWMMANLKNSILLTTSNRSEGDVGYATMDGDTSGSLAPIAAVDKHFIRNWLVWAETSLNYKSLRFVNRLKPSAELRPLVQTQTDEDDLMPYHILVEIEKLAIGKYKSPVEVFHMLKTKELEPDDLLKTHIRKFYSLWSRNQWKRERFAPSFHLDEFNVDPRTWYRHPILSGAYQDELAELEKLT